MKIDEAAREAKVHTQQLSIVHEKVHRERRYGSDGEVSNSFFEFLVPVLVIDDVQYRLFRKSEIHLLPARSIWRRLTNGHETALIYAAELEGGPVTLIQTDETLSPHNTHVSIGGGGNLPVDLTIFKRVMYAYLPMNIPTIPHAE